MPLGSMILRMITISIMTHSEMTLGILVSIQTLSIRALRRMTHGIMRVGITKISIMPLSIMILRMTTTSNDT
jgi:hypothetical protein